MMEAPGQRPQGGREGGATDPPRGGGAVGGTGGWTQSRGKGGRDPPPAVADIRTRGDPRTEGGGGISHLFLLLQASYGVREGHLCSSTS